MSSESSKNMVSDNLKESVYAKTCAADIMEMTTDPMMLLDMDLRVISANPSFYRTFNSSPSAFEGVFLRKSIDWWVIPELLAALESTVQEDSSFENLAVDGHSSETGEKKLLISGRRIEPEKEAYFILLAIKVLSDQEDMEALKKLKESENRFRTVLENSLDAAYHKNLLTNAYDYMSPVIEQITGYSAEEFNNMGMDILLERMHPDHVNAVNRELESVHSSGRSAGLLEYAFKSKDGDYRWVADSFRVIRNAEGEPSYRIGVVRDITGRKEMEQMMLSSLEAAETRAREAEAQRLIIEAVIDNMPEGFVLVDAETSRVLTVSRHLAEFAGMNKKDFENISLSEYSRRLNVTRLNGDAIKSENMPIYRTIKNGETVISEHYRLTNKDGETVTVLINTAPVRNASGKIIRGVAAWRNIEPLKRAQDALRLSRDAARDAMKKAEERRRILETILVSIPEGIIVIEAPDGVFRLVSKYYENFTGISGEDLKHISLEQRMSQYEKLGFHSEDSFQLIKNPSWRALRHGEVVMDEEVSITKPDGTQVMLSVIASPVRDEAGDITHAVTSFRDITESKKMESALRRTELEFRTLVENSPDIILRLDLDMRYLFVNAAYEQITGFPREYFVGEVNRDLGMPEEFFLPWEQGVKKAIQTGRIVNTEFSFQCLYGNRHFWGRIIPEFEPDGKMESVIMVARDITERKQAEEHIRYVSFHDTVTGLYNRAFFEEEMKRLDSDRLLPVSFIMGDLNNLKLVNDTFGHNEGDKLLRKIAEILKEICRTEDIIARWGGDEFAVILPGTHAETAKLICSRIKKRVASTSGTVIVPSIALGVAEKKQVEDNIYRVIREAEEHMYENKLAESRGNQDAVISSLLRRVQDKWPQFDDHIARSDTLARLFGEKLGFSDAQMEDLFLLIRLHDIGKAVVPSHLLQKSDRLSRHEWDLIKRHPEAGYRIVKTFGETAKISEAVLSQREHWDGSGYPRGLKEKEIPFLSRVFSIIDTFDVITHERPYARVFTRQEAIGEIRRTSGKQFDPVLSEAFISAISP
jgi:diguanylate cyclase (GGDEF)-like protein/PAS domain S-box-containing protein